MDRSKEQLLLQRALDRNRLAKFTGKMVA